MTVRVRPAEVEVPPDDPFKNDRLAREEPVRILASLLEKIDGPCVMAVDAPWGTGKTTFLKMLAAHLRRDGFSTTEFNAWETDFSGEPFAALTAELSASLAAPEGSEKGKRVAQTKRAALEVAKRALPGAIRISTAGLLDISPLLEEEIANALSNYAEEALERYGEAKESIEQFRGELSSLAATVAEESGGRPLIIVVDELDRCRPLYAIEFLESAKHLFSVDRVAFVVAVDRGELAHSVKAVYGSSFDATGYLRRFFDVDYSLPTPDRDDFVGELIRTSSIPAYFERLKGGDGDEEYLRKNIQELLGKSSASLRDIAQGVHRLSLVLNSLPDNRLSFAYSASALTVLRTLKPDVYRGFIEGEVSDREVFQAVFADPGLRRIADTHRASLFKASIIRCAIELEHDTEAWPELQALAKTEIPDGEAVPMDVAQARRIVDFVPKLQVGHIERTIGVHHTIRRLELWADTLLPDGT